MFIEFVEFIGFVGSLELMSEKVLSIRCYELQVAGHELKDKDVTCYELRVTGCGLKDRDVTSYELRVKRTEIIEYWIKHYP